MPDPSRTAEPESPWHWSDDRFAHLAELARANADLGVVPVSETEALEAGAALADYYGGSWPMGILWNDALWAACQERVAGLVLWARVPGAIGQHGSEASAGLYLHPDHPDRLWYSPSTELPAVLFVPLEASPEAVARALAQLGSRAKPVEPAEAKTLRAYAGSISYLGVPSPYSGEFEPAGPHELDRFFTFSPVVTSHAWGSAFDHDVLEGKPPASAVVMSATLRALREQAPGSLSRFTRRAFFSRALLSLELHPEGHYFWQVVYRPSQISTAVIRDYNALTGYRFPLDLPVDVAAAIQGFEFLDLAWAQTEIDKEPDLGRRQALIRLAFGVAYDDIEAAQRIAAGALSRSPDEALTVANAALRYNWEFLLAEVGLTTTDPVVREQVERILVAGIAPPPLNEFGEPTDVYDAAPASEGCEDDEDETGDDEEEQDDA